MSDYLDYRGALRFVNSLRLIARQEPLEALRPGHKRKPNSCPIAMSLNDVLPDRPYSNEAPPYLVVTSDHVLYGAIDIPLSEAAQNFIQSFDRGEYPDLLL